MVDVLVTGAAGFVGKRLVERLTAKGIDCLALTRQHGDIAAAGTWEELPPARTVVHLAGRSYVPDSWASPAAFIESNVSGTAQALAYCKRTGASLVFASAYLYGIPQHLPIGEDHAVSPNNPYAVSKYLAENLCIKYGDLFGIRTISLRIFNVFGKNQRSEFLIPTILNQVINRDRVIMNDLEPKRDYIYLEDVVDALEAAMQVPDGHESVNIGSGVSHSVQAIVDQIQEVLGTSLPVSGRAERRHNEIPDVVADIEKARILLGWQPRWSLRAGLADMLEKDA